MTSLAACVAIDLRGLVANLQNQVQAFLASRVANVLQIQVKWEQDQGRQSEANPNPYH